ncbi:hypothetical protein BE21_04580 [Sorangium cellulosum]|uniref:Tail protein n=1 Tax=Sorangium cellulosum TaxID=56 RepID=A0A150TFV3_SORCE|nr:hypothetical protein BE21_04580 [Sorangium cellulosum]
MSEYLAPGVYIEERPGQRTIEGVATSTAGFVGMTERGPIEGPPVMVGSLGEFQRQFGAYLPITRDGEGNHHGYLPLAVKHFFDNGGRRAFIARVFKAKGDVASETRRLKLKTGVVARLRANAPKNVDTLYFSTLRGFSPAATLFRERGTSVVKLKSARLAMGEVKLSSPLTDDHRADTAFCELTALKDGAEIRAREPGVWGEGVRIQIRPMSGPASRLESITPAGDGEHSLKVASTATFYVGGAIEIATERGDDLQSLHYATVKKIVGDTLIIVTPSAALPKLDASAGPGNLRASVSLAEVEILVSWGTVVERFRGSWWYMNPEDATPFEMTPRQRDEFNATRSAWVALHQRSRLVALEGDGAWPAVAAVIPYDPAAPIDSHPTTDTGYPTALRPVSGSRGQPDLPPGDIEYIGNAAAPAGKRSGLAALGDEETIALVAAPGIVSASVQAALVSHAEKLKYRFAVLDGPKDANIGAIRQQRGAVDSSRAALYYPWVEVAHPLTGEPLHAPPSGIVLGVYGRNDGERGVHKAPANEIALGATDVVTRVLHEEQEVLNPEGINVIRDFRPENRGIRIWGARTLSSDPLWKYINVRRLFIYLERSISQGTQWAVFEPNNSDLWGRVRRGIEAFLEDEWRAGALSGAKAEEAFYVRCDRSTMSLQDIEDGRLVCEIGVAPSRPAEFVIFRVGQLTADARTA